MARSFILACLIVFGSLAGVQAASNAPFDGFLVLDGDDDVASAHVSAPTGDAITLETFFLLETGSNSPVDRLEILATDAWVFFVVRYSLAGTRTGCIGYLGPGGWEHCRTSTMGLNVWHHVAFTVQNGQGQFFLDGQPFGNPRSISVPTLRDSLTVGSNLHGRMDEVRISDRARYDANYPVPTQKFVCDDGTIALWGFDEPNGATVFGGRCGGPTLVGQNGAHSEGGPVLTPRVYLPLLLKTS